MSQDGEDRGPRGSCAPETPGSGDDGGSDNRSILVSNIPAAMNDDKVMIHFQRLSNGGGDVRKVTRLSPSQAKVVFEDVKVIEKVTARKQEMDGVTLQVKSWPSFLGWALEMDRHKEFNCIQRAVVQIHQPVSQLVWHSYEQKMSKNDVSLKRSTKNDTVTFKGSWNDVVEARNLFFDLICETDAVKSSLDQNSKESGQKEESITTSLEQHHHAPCVTPADDGRHQPQTINNGTENPDQPGDKEDLNRKQTEEADATRPRKRREGNSHDASGSTNPSQIRNSLKMNDSVRGYTRSHSVELREGSGLKEAMGDGRPSTLPQSMSDPDDASSAHGVSNDRSATPKQGKTPLWSLADIPREVTSSKHSSAYERQDAAATDVSISNPRRHKTASDLAMGQGSETMTQQQLHPSQDRGITSSTYKLPDISAEEDDDEAMEETTVEQTVNPDILSYIIKVHSSEINLIARKHGVNFDHSKDNSTVYFKGDGKNVKTALDDFISMYQTLFKKLDCRSLDTYLHDVQIEACIDAVELAQDSHPSVFLKTVDGSITFIGDEQEIRAARATVCNLLGITESRRRRGNLSVKVSPASVGGQRNAQPAWCDLSMPGRVQFQEKTTGVQITIVQGDITNQYVDIIVNAANCSLSLAVGVSGAISKAGGWSIQSECRDYIIKHGNPRVTDCVWTSPGKLPCKYIIHAIGPIFVSGSDSVCKQELYDTCQKALVTAASRLNAKSIAMPAISSGMSGMPRRLCADAMCSAIVDFVENRSSAGSGLLDIKIVDYDRETIQAFCDAFKAKVATASSGATGYGTSGNMTAKYPPCSPNYGSGSHLPHGSNIYPGPTQTFLAAASPSYASGSSTPSYPHSTPNYPNGGPPHTYSGASQMQPGTYQSSLGQTKTSSQSMSSGVTSTSSSSGNSDKDDTCPICLCDFTAPVTTPQCKHKFCADCLDRAMKVSGQCPICKTVIGRLKGNQPVGTMTDRIDYLNPLPGYESSRSTIEIHYYFPGGVQGQEHPNPGKHYTGTSRRAYLPDNIEGREVLRLLRRAFDSRLVFTIGTSATTGATDTVVWNDIHHKTSKYGGPNSYGYPDPDYLRRVKEELAAKGIK